MAYAFDNGTRKKIWVGDGAWDFVTGFTEFAFDVDQAHMVVEFSPGAELKVPNGYTGNLFNFQEGSTRTKLLGGIFNEQGAQQRLWTCYHFESGSSSGVNTCTVRDSYVRNANRAIFLETSGVTGGTPIGWINNCDFQDVFIDRSVVGIEFNMGSTSFGMNRNFFKNVLIQAFGTTTTHGVKNLAGDGGEFWKVHVYDLDAGAIYTNLTSTAIDTVIFGGRMTSTNASQYIDNGVGTIVRDKWLRKWGRTGIISDTGTGAKLTFSTQHGLGITPTYWNGAAANSNARAVPFYVTADATFVYFVLSSAPANGAAVSWAWEVAG